MCEGENFQKCPILDKNKPGILQGIMLHYSIEVVFRNCSAPKRITTTAVDRPVPVWDVTQISMRSVRCNEMISIASEQRKRLVLRRFECRKRLWPNSWRKPHVPCAAQYIPESFTSWPLFFNPRLPLSATPLRVGTSRAKQILPQLPYFPVLCSPLRTRNSNNSFLACSRSVMPDNERSRVRLTHPG